MIREFMNRLFSKLAKATAPKPMSVSDYCKAHTADKSIGASMGTGRTSQHVNVETVKQTMQERILEADEIKEMISNIQAEIIAKGYKEIPDILEQYPTCVIQNFVTLQKVSLGEYDPEKDNFDALTRVDLIEMAIDLNQEQFRHRMISQGKAQVTAKQKETIENLAQRLKITIEMPKDRFEASDLIDKLIGQAPKENKPMIGHITEAQYRRINWLCTKLNKPMPRLNSIAEASMAIQTLQTEFNAHPELNVDESASKEQVEYVKRLLKALGKRWTKVQEAKYTAMTKHDISTVINDLKAQVPEEAYASQGQVDYIVSLCERLSRPCNVSEVKNMKKEDATKLIDTLRRDYLYILAKANGTELSRESINLMTAQAVKELMQNIQMEVKTKFYTKDVDEVM